MDKKVLISVNPTLIGAVQDTLAGNTPDTEQRLELKKLLAELTK